MHKEGESDFRQNMGASRQPKMHVIGAPWQKLPICTSEAAALTWVETELEEFRSHQTEFEFATGALNSMSSGQGNGREATAGES